jgi:hypothetical protein
MPWRGPEVEGEFPSLGYELVEWLQEFLKVPAGPMYGQPMRLTRDQVEFFVRLYALDEKGRRLWRRASRRASKGKGKSPEGAMFCIAEFAGPVQFAGWDSDGEPMGKARDYPWVQIAACSEEQDHNLYGPMREMLAESALNAENGGNIDTGKTRIEFKNGLPGKIEPVSASAGAREGQPITAAALEETHLWFPSQGGIKLAAVLRRNVGKTNGVTCEFTNAPALGEGSVAEMTMDAANNGTAGLLYDCREGSFVEDPKNPDNRKLVIASLKEAYDNGGGRPVPWVDVERQYAETQDPDVTEADVYRFYLNIARKAENRAFDPKAFDALAEPNTNLRDWTGLGYTDATIGRSGIAEDEACILVFDGARTRDCAVFTAWTLGDTPKHHHVASWARPWNATAGYQHPRGEYKAVAREFIASHNVIMFAYDSSFRELGSLYEDWTDEYGEFDGKSEALMMEFPTNEGQRMQKALLRVLEDTGEGLYRHDGHPVVTEHVHNAVAVKNRGGWMMLAKEKDSLKIDAAVTLTFGYDLIPLARTAAQSSSVIFAFT